MGKREVAISKAKGAGYHGDTRAFTRLIVESRVNRQTMNAAWADGVSAKQRGVRCTCFECERRGVVGHASQAERQSLHDPQGKCGNNEGHVRIVPSLITEAA